MRVLFIHQNFPGQFQGLLPYYHGRTDVEVIGIGERRWVKDKLARLPRGFKVGVYDFETNAKSEAHPYLTSTSTAVLRGQAVVKTLLNLKHQGFSPDIVYAHPGWGESLFVKDVFPDCRLVHFCEFFYRSKGQDVGFDPEYPSHFDEALHLRIRNAPHLLSLDVMDLGISPTQWQRSCFPKPYQSNIAVVHDGIDTDHVRPNPEASFTLPNGRQLTRRDEVITFVNRNLEPSRGFHTFMRALPALLQQRPQAQIIIIGGDEVSYGSPSRFGSYRAQMLDELGEKLDQSRIHFLGKVSYGHYLQALQVSTAHVYLTYPFVLSWSMLEAMAAGCLVIGSRTAPVVEVIEDGQNGLLVDFFSPDDIVQRIIEVCAHPDQMAALRHAARQTILERYDLQRICLPKQVALLEQVTAHTANTVLTTAV
ncbi:glycosyltransferase family 4 protein [Aquitalea sp. USM4]|uniref:glycosyltransferase family 4 protein n=1 Tax=Aquitalea sp. USM4 TaxID=1590041 RepID=UPI00103FFDD6|nr:glycosyltransferase family 4 protein [Aquitalea sp. USM4]QBJ77868.1 glycosyl transferase family 1 [Aquitalea sp. USM4]